MSPLSLNTDRLTLRKPEARDFDAFADFVSRDRSKWVGGPSTREEAKEGFAENLRHWDEHGYGYFHVERREDAAALGRVGIRKSNHRPEPEVAYSLYADEFEGHGYATEAAIAVRHWGYHALGLPKLVSYIDPANIASAAVATRLNARPDGTAPGWNAHPDLTVYRHPAPEDCL